MRVSVLTISDSVSAGKSEDASGPAVIARCRALGWQIASSSVLADDRAAIEQFLKKSADSGDADLILTTGGVSTGEEDHVKAGVEAVGSLVLWRMAIKPGRPVAMGIIGGTPFIGLPGNPVASSANGLMSPRSGESTRRAW